MPNQVNTMSNQVNTMSNPVNNMSNQVNNMPNPVNQNNMSNPVNIMSNLSGNMHMQNISNSTSNPNKQDDAILKVVNTDLHCRDCPNIYETKEAFQRHLRFHRTGGAPHILTEKQINILSNYFEIFKSEGLNNEKLGEISKLTEIKSYLYIKNWFNNKMNLSRKIGQKPMEKVNNRTQNFNKDPRISKLSKYSEEQQAILFYYMDKIKAEGTNLSKPIVAEISRKTSIDARSVHYWFDRERAKDRKSSRSSPEPTDTSKAEKIRQHDALQAQINQLLQQVDVLQKELDASRKSLNDSGVGDILDSSNSLNSSNASMSSNNSINSGNTSMSSNNSINQSRNENAQRNPSPFNPNGHMNPTGPMQQQPVNAPTQPHSNGPMQTPNSPMQPQNSPMQTPNSPMQPPNGPMQTPNGPMQPPPHGFNPANFMHPMFYNPMMFNNPMMFPNPYGNPPFGNFNQMNNPGSQVKEEPQDNKTFPVAPPNGFPGAPPNGFPGAPPNGFPGAPHGFPGAPQNGFPGAPQNGFPGYQHTSGVKQEPVGLTPSA